MASSHQLGSRSIASCTIASQSVISEGRNKVIGWDTNILRLIDGKPNWHILVISGDDKLGVANVVVNDLWACPSLGNS